MEKKNENYSLGNLTRKIATSAESEVFFYDEIINNIKKDKINKIFTTHNIILLENLRFFPEEEKNDESFAKKISSLADIYVNECFSTCHRKTFLNYRNSKVFALLSWNITRKGNFKPKKLIQVTDQSSSTAVFGGSKVSTKIKIIDFYIKNLIKF